MASGVYTIEFPLVKLPCNRPHEPPYELHDVLASRSSSLEVLDPERVLYFPHVYPELFADQRSVCRWLLQGFQKAAAIHPCAQCILICDTFIVNDIYSDVCITVRYHDLQASSFEFKSAADNMRPATSSNPSWAFMTIEEVVQRLDKCSLRELRKVPGVPCEERAQKAQVARYVARLFTETCYRYIAMCDFEVCREYITCSANDGGDLNRRMALWAIMSNTCTEYVFRVIVKPTGPSDMGLTPSDQTVNEALASVCYTYDFAPSMLFRRLKEIDAKELKQLLSDVLRREEITDMRISKKGVCDILSRSLCSRWKDLLCCTSFEIGDVLSRCQSQVDLRSPFNMVNLLKHKYNERICEYVVEPVRRQVVSAMLRDERRKANDEDFGELEAKFREVCEEWPQAVGEDAILERCRQFQAEYTWPERMLCAVCTRETYRGEPLKFHVQDISELLQQNVGGAMRELLRLRVGERFQNRIHHRVLRTLMLDCRAFHDNKLRICTNCYAALKAGRLPQFSLRNELYRGELPEKFQTLTWVEEMMCSIHRCTAHVTRLYNSSQPHQPRVLHGNTCAHNMNVVSTAKVLPRVPEDLRGMISVVFVGPTQTLKKALKGGFKIRKCLVMGFLWWLQENNPLYQRIKIDFDLFKHYPDDDDVLPGLWDDVFHDDSSNAAEMFEEETAGFEAHFAGTLEDDQTGNEETLLERMGVSDIEAVHMTGRAFTAAALDNLIRPPNVRPDIVVFRSRDPVSDYNNPTLFPGMFPTLFPYGKGGFDDKTRSPSITMESQSNYFLDLYDRDVRYHNSFVFVAMNIIQRHQMDLHTHFAVRGQNFDAVARVVEGIRPETISAVARHLREGGTLETLNGDQRDVYTLLKEVNTISGKVTGSEASKIMYRNEIRSYVGHFGIPHLFFTANPNPVHNPLFQVMWGDETVDLSTRFPVLVKWNTRARRLASDPVAALDFFNHVMKVIFKCLFGWDFEHRRSTIDGGILGYLECFYAVDELTERGSYHRHCLITLKGGLNPSDMHRKLDDDIGFTRRFFQYVEGIIEHHLPVGVEWDPKENPKKQCPVRIPRVDATEDVFLRFYDDITRDLKLLGERLQRHKHGPVCTKYGHTECRFHMPLEEVLESFYDKEKRCIVFQCLDGEVNYFNRWILLMCRFNHDLKTILSGKACTAAMFYVTDYITKMSLKTHEMLSLLSEGVTNARNAVAEGNQNLRAKVVLQKCLSQFARAQQVHAQHAVRILRGQKEVFYSHETAAMRSGELMHYVQKKWPYLDVDTADEVEDDVFRMQIGPDGKLIRRSQVDDYLHRSTQLKDVTFYDFVARYYIVRVNSEERDELSEYIAGQRLSKFNRFNFIPGYKCRGTWEIAERLKEQDSRVISKVVPRIVGHRLPRMGSVDYYAFMCSHFIPFSVFVPLLRDGEDFESRFNTYSFGERALKCIRNWEAMHECEDERDRERLRKREAQMRESRIITNSLNSDTFEELIELTRSGGTVNAKEDRLQAVLLEIGLSQWFSRDSTQSVEPPLQTTMDFIQMDRWKRQIKSIQEEVVSQRNGGKKNLDQDRRKSDFIPETSLAVSLSSTSNVPGDFVRDSVSTVTDERITLRELIERIVDGHHLNPEQADAFRIMATCYAQRKASEVVTAANVPVDEGYDAKGELRLFLTGPGGTGKTYAINALIQLMKEFNSQDAIRFVALTGSAAANCDGQTLHKACSITVVSDKASKHTSRSLWGEEKYTALLSVKERERLQNEWQDVDVLVIDEISLVAQELLTEIDAACRYGKSVHDKWFGGMITVFCGDMYQYPPVKGHSLYSRIIGERVDDISLKRRLGRMAWSSITDAVFLHRQKRMEEDMEYASAVQRLRVGECTDEDVNLFNSRVVKSSVTPDGLDMSVGDRCSAVAIVRMNAMRHAINTYKARANCDPEQLITVAAHDVTKDPLVVLSAEDRRALLVNDVSTLTGMGALPGLLYFYIGMPVIMRSKNLSTDLKVTNGAKGVLRYLELTVDEFGFSIAKGAIVEFPLSNFQLNGLLPNCFPIEPIPWSFTYAMKTANGNPVRAKITRYQLPFQGGFCMTGHVAQGQTLPRVLVSMTEGGAAAYVAASRAQTRHGLFLRHAVRRDQLNRPIPRDLTNEMRKFAVMAENTRVKFGLSDGVIQVLTDPIEWTPYKIEFDTKEPRKRKRKAAEHDPAPKKKIRSTKNRQEIGVRRHEHSVDAQASKSYNGRRPQRGDENPGRRERQGNVTQVTCQVQHVPTVTRDVPLSWLVGCRWDPANWSCAYDSVCTALFVIQKSLPCEVTADLRCSSKYTDDFLSACLSDPFDLNAARDRLRDVISTEFPDLFPREGPRMAPVATLLALMVGNYKMQLSVTVVCPSGCSVPAETRPLNVSSICAPSRWQDVKGLSDATAMANADMTEWIDILSRSTVMRSNRMLQALNTAVINHSNACSDGGVPRIALQEAPPMLCVEISTELVGIFCVSETAMVAVQHSSCIYHLRGVIYCTDVHFTARIYTADRWFDYDGQVAEGTLVEEQSVNKDLNYFAGGRAHLLMYVLALAG